MPLRTQSSSRPTLRRATPAASRVKRTAASTRVGLAGPRREASRSMVRWSWGARSGVSGVGGRSLRVNTGSHRSNRAWFFRRTHFSQDPFPTPRVKTALFVPVPCLRSISNYNLHLRRLVELLAPVFLKRFFSTRFLLPTARLRYAAATSGLRSLTRSRGRADWRSHGDERPSGGVRAPYRPMTYPASRAQLDSHAAPGRRIFTRPSCSSFAATPGLGDRTNPTALLVREALLWLLLRDPPPKIGPKTPAL